MIPLRNNLVRLILSRPATNRFYTITGSDEGFPFPILYYHQSRLQNLLVKSRIREKNDTINFQKAKTFLNETVNGNSKFYSWNINHALAVLLNNKSYYPFVDENNEVKSKFLDDWLLMVEKLNDRKNKSKIEEIHWNNLRQELTNIDFSSLRILVTSLSKLPKNSEDDFRKLSFMFDQASVDKLERFNTKNLLPYFQLCYSWFKILIQFNQRDAHDWRHTGVQYPMKFVKTALLDYPLGHYSNGELFFLIYISSFYRNLPGSSKTTFSDTDYVLNPILEEKCVKFWSSWNYLEKGVLCNSLYMCSINLNFRNHELREGLKQSFLDMPNDLICDRVLTPLQSMCKVLAKDSIQPTFNSNEIREIMNKFGPHLKTLEYAARMRLLRVITQNRVDGKDVQWFLDELIDTIEKELKYSRRCKDFELLITAMYDIGVHTNKKSQKVLHEILEAALATEDSDIRMGRSLVNLIVGMARMGVINNNAINHLLKDVNNFQPFHESEGLKNLSYAGLQFLFSMRQVGHPESKKRVFSENFIPDWDKRYNARKIPTSVVSRELSSNLNLNLGALHKLAEIDYLIEMDFPNYSGTRLDKKIRSKLIRLDRKINSFDIKQDIEPNLDLNNGTEKHRRFVFQEILKFIPSNNVYFGPTLPHRADMSDIIFCANSDLETMEIDPDFRSKLEANIEIPKLPSTNSKNFSWYCVVMPRENHLTQNGSFKGYLLQKIKHLTQVGYSVHVLKPKKSKYFERNGLLSKKDVESMLVPYIRSKKISDLNKRQ